MSFSMTKAQLLDGSKTVTRRLGWGKLKPGDRLLAVSKCMGLKKGEKADVYGVIEVVSVRAERLCLMMPTDCAREGFPKADVKEFVRMFCATMGCKPTDMVNRIEFRRVPEC
jgi:hypothetical protein